MTHDEEHRHDAPANVPTAGAHGERTRDEAAPGAAATVSPILLRGAQAAALLNISRAKFYAMDKAGLVPRARRFGSLKLWSELELVEWVRDGCPARQLWEARKR